MISHDVIVTTIQIKQLSRQLAVCKTSLEHSDKKQTASETLMKKMEQEAKRKEWSMVDEVNAKDTWLVK